VLGGRQHALSILKKCKRGDFKDYDKERNLPALDKTTRLSAYLKFGCISIREAFYTIADTYGDDHGLVRELIWREFYANITFNKPRVLQGQISKSKRANLPFKEKYDTQKWTMNAQQKAWFTRWCNGTTGFPIVDAAMRQLNTTGWMHNRCRMIVASFLIKDMLVDWRLGEEYFAKMLVDYDPSSNNGGWQFCSSTGVDAQPYFRIFNPFSQSSKFDPNATYIKHWVPELSGVEASKIHEWEKWAPTTTSQTSQYPAPMLVHKEQAKKALDMYKVIK
jgi:deoxyribodipyrimidine photo-lyase